jgi:3-deoxy-manno-octulosonate cytidylyltransferase (CMP-KDO synthetase)
MKILRTLGIIPARFASTRLPGKPLLMIKGLSMIERVYRQALKANSLDAVVVATDDERIFSHVQSFGGAVVMTSQNHRTGTDRCAETASLKPWSDYEIMINIQGDEPLIDPEQINLLASMFIDPSVRIATLVRPVTDLKSLLNPNVVKVTIGNYKQAVCFSRSPIPYLRNYPGDQWLKHHTFYEHIGMYGFTSEMLHFAAQLSPSENETAESLEQLRWLDHGISIATSVSRHLSFSIDTPDDLQTVISLIEDSPDH